MNGLCGAHRTGKTTLAKLYAERAGIPFLETSVSKGVFDALGLSPRIDYPFDVRLTIQEKILDCLEDAYHKQGGKFIADRTPIDAIAYTLADVQRANIDDATSERVIKYMERGFKITNSYFCTLLIVQPGITIVDEPGKAPPNVAYIEHLNQLIMGLASDERIEAAHFYVPRKMVDLEQRLSCLEFAIKRTGERYEMLKKAKAEAGTPIILH